MTRTHTLRVTVLAEQTITLTVDVEDGTDPTDLTKEEVRKAFHQAATTSNWRMKLGYVENCP